MKKTLSTVIMLLILMFALSTNVQAYTMSFTGKTEVESGETFNVTISVDEATTLANGQLSYDTSLFTFVGATQDDNMAAQAYPSEGKVKWMYTELKTEPVGVNSFVFTFKAAEVEETKKGTFTLNDFVVTTATDAEYDQAASTISGSNSVEVTINKKVTEPTWTLNPSDDFELEVGDTKTIETDGDVTWTTSDSKVATVDKNGKVTAVKEGTATITATDKDGNTKSVKVTVVAKDELTLSPSGNIKLEIGESQKVETNKEVTWTTSNSKVATVDKNGKITAVGAGTATITATDKDGNKKTIKVTVTAKDTTSGKKDNTTTNDSKLPQTGEDFARFACLGLAAVILAAGLVFKKKAKNLGKLFVILPLVAIMSLSGVVNAIKIVDDETMKAGVFAAGELLEDEDVVAVSPCKNFTTEDKLTLEMIENIMGMTTNGVVDAEGTAIENPEYLATGYVISTPHPYSKEGENVIQVVEDYTVLLYGDANGDGKICNCLDVNVIRQDYVFNNKAEGVYKLAADLYADDVLNVRDVQRMIKKYLGTLDGSLVTPFPGEKEIVLEPDEDNITLKIGEQITITPEDPNVTWSWDSDNKSAYISTTVDGIATITGANCGTIDLTVTDEDGNEKIITITVIGGTIVLNNCTSTTIETEVSLDIEGKEIASIEHFYAFQAGYMQGTSEPKSAGTTTESIFTYTNEILAINNPYTFYAEITTTDGEVYKTNSVTWYFGTEYPKPTDTEVEIEPNTDFELEVDESQTIKANENVDWSWDEDSDIADVVVNDDGSITVTGKNPGEIDITATDENGNEKTITVTVVAPTGETDDESAAVARVESTGKMYITVQYAVNAAANTDTVTMLKDSTEAVTIPKEKNITLAMGNQTLTGVVNEEGTSYAVKVLGDLTVKSLESGSTITLPYLGVEENTSTIILEGDANLTLETITNEDGTTTALDIGNQNTNTSEMIDSNNIKEHAVILNNGTGDININGLVTVSGHTNNRGYYGAITDNGNGSNITITKGRVSSSTIGIVKTGSGTITIGENVNEITGLGVLQVYAEKTPLLVNPNVTVNFYQGNLVTTTTDPEIGRTDPDYVDGYMHGVCIDEIKTTEEGSVDVVHEFDAINDNENILLVGGADETSASYRELVSGETKDVSEAVAENVTQGLYYTKLSTATKQAAAGDTLQILKDVEESFTVHRDLILDLNGHTITATDAEYAITNNGNLTIMNSDTSVGGQITTPNNSGFTNESMHTIITKGNLTITTNDDGTSSTQINLHPKADDDTTATIKNIGTNNTIKITGGAILGGSANPTRYLNAAILDENTGSTIIVEKGQVGGYIGIKKTGSGTINIGTNEQELWGTTTGPTDHVKLSVGGTGGALLVDENVKVNFYNGYLQSTTEQVSRNVDGTTHEFDAYRDGFGTTIGMCGSADWTAAYYREPYFTDNGETLNKEEAVAQLLTYPGGYYTTIEGAMQAAIDSGSMNGGTVKLLKSTTESVEQPTGSIFKLDLNGNTLTGADDGTSTISVENGGLTITNSTGNGQVLSAIITETTSATSNISLNNSSLVLEPEDGTTLRVELRNDTTGCKIPNIYKVGSKDIVIKGTTYVVGPSYGGSIDTEAILDEGTGDIKVYSGLISGGKAIEKTSSGTIWIGFDYISGEVATGNDLRISGTYACLLVNESCKVYYYDGILNNNTTNSNLKTEAMVCANEILDTDNDGYVDTFEVHDFDETRENDASVKLNGTASSSNTSYSVITTASVAETGTDAATEALEAAAQE